MNDVSEVHEVHQKTLTTFHSFGANDDINKQLHCDAAMNYRRIPLPRR